MQQSREFFIVGKPEPQGSMRAFIRAGRAIITSANPKLKKWRETVATAVRDDSFPPLSGPVEVMLVFSLARPKSRRKQKWPWQKPDFDKLTRAVCDGLTDGGVWNDDAQVCIANIGKSFHDDEDALLGGREGVWVHVSCLDDVRYAA